MPGEECPIMNGEGGREPSGPDILNASKSSH